MGHSFILTRIRRIPNRDFEPAYRELDDTLSLTDTGADRLAEVGSVMNRRVIVRQVASGDTERSVPVYPIPRHAALRCPRSTASCALLLTASANCRCSRR